MRRLGVLMAVAESDADARKGIGILQERLQKLGWKDGNNIRIDYRWGNGNPDRIQDLAKELVELQPDVLVGHTTPSAKGLLKQTHTIPIVFLSVADPMGQGLVSVSRIQPEISRVSRILRFHSAPNGLRFSSKLCRVFGESLPFSTPRLRPITGCFCNRLTQARLCWG
jgi:hypothetical protein